MAPTRRDLFRTTAAVGAAGIARWFAPHAAAAAEAQSLLPARGHDAFTWATEAERAFLEAAVDRLIPSDDLGPGAREAGVAFFIDQQMGGPFGRGETWYMQGPWKEGSAEQGYQLKLTPAQLYRASIAAIDSYCLAHHGEKVFAQLDAKTQDDVLRALEKGEIDLDGPPAKAFFDLLLQNTNEGFFADPIYGGNRHFAGWKLVGFPGPRYNYVNEIGRFGEPYPLPAVGLAGRDGEPRRA